MKMYIVMESVGAYSDWHCKPVAAFRSEVHAVADAKVRTETIDKWKQEIRNIVNNEPNVDEYQATVKLTNGTFDSPYDLLDANDYYVEECPEVYGF